MATRFRMSTYGMDENTETFKKAYPKTFQRYFFRWIKAITSKGGKLNLNDEAGIN